MSQQPGISQSSHCALIAICLGILMLLLTTFSTRCTQRMRGEHCAGLLITKQPVSVLHGPAAGRHAGHLYVMLRSSSSTPILTYA